MVSVAPLLHFASHGCQSSSFSDGIHCHWWVKGGVPVAWTLKLADFPRMAFFSFFGWSVILGASATQIKTWHHLLASVGLNPLQKAPILKKWLVTELTKHLWPKLALPLKLWLAFIKVLSWRILFHFRNGLQSEQVATGFEARCMQLAKSVTYRNFLREYCLRLPYSEGLQGSHVLHFSYIPLFDCHWS